MHLRRSPGAAFAYFCVLACVFVTAAYTFRLVFMAFHGERRGYATHGAPRTARVARRW